MILFSTPQSSCYIEIVRIKYKNDRHLKAHIKWYSKPGMTFIREERNIKIPRQCLDFWEKTII